MIYNIGYECVKAHFVKYGIVQKWANWTVNIEELIEKCSQCLVAYLTAERHTPSAASGCIYPLEVTTSHTTLYPYSILQHKQNPINNNK